MKVAVVQTDPVFGRTRDNIDAALAMMEASPADLYVLPELFASGYTFASAGEAGGLAEPFPGGPSYGAMKEFAERRRAVVVYGFAERHGDAVYNAAGLVGFGTNDALYRKVHLFDREKEFFRPGDLGFTVAETPVGRIGIMICFDWYFPESMRTLALKGAQLVAHPSNLVLPHCPDSMPTRCLENRVYAATANRIGTESRGGHTHTFIGKSQITAPKGTVLRRAPADAPAILVEEVDVTNADDKSINERNHLFHDRRPEFYE